MRQIALQSVESGMFSRMGYDALNHVLRVEYKKGGAVYDFSLIAADVAEKVMYAPSVGSAFHEFIESKGFKGLRVPPNELE